MIRTGVMLAAMATASLAQAVTVTAPNSSGPWNGYMNVFQLPSNGSGYVFGSGWGLPDLVSSFNDGAGTITMAPNTIGDPNNFWYQNTTGTAPDPVNPGGPGQKVNKSMQANLYIEVNDNSLSGQSVTFEGVVLSNTYTSAHTASIFIRDFAPDYSSSNDVFIPATPGPFSFSLATNPGPGRHVQYGFQTAGENVWVTDVAPFGNVVFGPAVPEPASALLVGAVSLFGLALPRRR